MFQDHIGAPAGPPQTCVDSLWLTLFALSQATEGDKQINESPLRIFHYPKKTLRLILIGLGGSG